MWVPGRKAPPPYTALVQAAAKAVGADNPRQLADAIGLSGRDEDKVVRNWWNGVNAPSYDATMRLLAVAGWLNLSGEPAEPLDDEEQAEVATQLDRAMDALQKLRQELGK